MQSFDIKFLLTNPHEFPENVVNKVIKNLSDSYYQGKPDISDKEFDEFIERVKVAHPNCPALTKTGWGYEVDGDGKVKHPLGPITGIGRKVRTIEDLVHNVTSANNGDTNIDLVITPKLDGGSVTVHYKQGKFYLAISRGNGEYGQDITNSIKQLKSVPHTIKDNELQVRGEIIIPINNTLGIDTVRNSATGFSQSKYIVLDEVSSTQYIFVAYSILNKEFTKKSDELRYLASLGFAVPPYDVINFNRLKEFNKVIEDELSHIDSLVITNDHWNITNDIWKLPIDGYVLEPNTNSIKSSENAIYDRPKVAWKIDSDAATTKVNNIRWSMSNKGKYTPVAEVETVWLDQANISNVTMNSHRFLTERKCGKGSTIEIIRSGGVIPKHYNTIEESEDYEMPTHCTYCGTALAVDGAHLYCISSSCSGKVDLFAQIHGNFPIKGFGWTVYELMLDIFNIETENDMKEFMTTIMTTDNNYLLLGKDISESKYKLIDSWLTLVKSWQLDLVGIINLANIPNIGYNQAVGMAEILRDNNYSLKSNDLMHLFSNNTHIELLKPALNSRAYYNLELYHNKIRSIIDVFEEKIGLQGLVYLNAYHYPEVKVVNHELPKVLLTNIAKPYQKSVIINDFKDKYTFVDSVKDCDILVYTKEGSSKYNEAMNQGKKIMSTEELYNGK